MQATKGSNPPPSFCDGAKRARPCGQHLSSPSNPKFPATRSFQKLKVPPANASELFQFAIIETVEKSQRAALLHQARPFSIALNLRYRNLKMPAHIVQLEPGHSAPEPSATPRVSKIYNIYPLESELYPRPHPIPLKIRYLPTNARKIKNLPPTRNRMHSESITSRLPPLESET